MGVPQITSPDLVSAKLGGTFYYRTKTDYVDENGQTYSLTAQPTGMTIDVDTGIITWPDIPITTSTSTPVTFTVGVTNSYGTTTKQISINVEIPDSYKPEIAEQEINVVYGSQMIPYVIRGTNVYVTTTEGE